MNQDLLEWLLLHYGQENMRPGLERISKALQHLIPSLKKIRIITIAGTNGKGETTLRLSKYLLEHHHLAWTSPHIERITERFRDQTGEIEFQNLFSLIHLCHEKVVLEKWELSFYEFLFFVFCTWAVKVNPEFLLLEVGLGGRLDAVNVLDAELVLLPSISRDHQEVLGKRYDQILAEKLAVLRPRKMLISYLDSKYLRELTARHVQEQNCHLLDLEEFKAFLPYDFSCRNQLLAYAAFLHIQGIKFDIKRLQSWRPEEGFLEHRGEVIKGIREWILFGSHNTDGLRKLIQFLHSANYNFSRPPYEAIIVAFSRRETRDLRAMLLMLKASGLGKIVITSFDHPKAASRDLIQELSHQEGLTFVLDINEYIQKKGDAPVLITGSYYFLGHFKSLLGRGTTTTESRG